MTAWASLFEYAWHICSAPLKVDKAAPEVTRRDAEMGAADSPRNSWLGSVAIVRGRSATYGRRPDLLVGCCGPGRAVLLLDAMSLREVPWILEGATQRGYTVHQAHGTGAELPADTTPFAQASVSKAVAPCKRTAGPRRADCQARRRTRLTSPGRTARLGSTCPRTGSFGTTGRMKGFMT